MADDLSTAAWRCLLLHQPKHPAKRQPFRISTSEISGSDEGQRHRAFRQNESQKPCYLRTVSMPQTPFKSQKPHPKPQRIPKSQNPKPKTILKQTHQSCRHAATCRNPGLSPQLPLVQRPALSCEATQRLQYPLIREYTLNYSRIPNMTMIASAFSVQQPAS